MLDIIAPPGKHGIAAEVVRRQQTTHHPDGRLKHRRIMVAVAKSRRGVSVLQRVNVRFWNNTAGYCCSLSNNYPIRLAERLGE
jgi:hypothetical protein